MLLGNRGSRKKTKDLVEDTVTKNVLGGIKRTTTSTRNMDHVFSSGQDSIAIATGQTNQFQMISICEFAVCEDISVCGD